MNRWGIFGKTSYLASPVRRGTLGWCSDPASASRWPHPPGRRRWPRDPRGALAGHGGDPSCTGWRTSTHPILSIDNWKVGIFLFCLSYLRDCWWFLKVVSPCRPQCTLMTYNSHRNAELSTQWSHTMKKSNCQRGLNKIRILSLRLHTWLGSWLNIDIRRLFSVLTLCSISKLKLHLLLKIIKNIFWKIKNNECWLTLTAGWNVSLSSPRRRSSTCPSRGRGRCS